MTTKAHHQRVLRPPASAVVPPRMLSVAYRPRPNAALQNAFASRLQNAVKQLLDRADESVMEKALAAPTDTGLLARALSDSAVAIEAEEILDPLAELIARGAEVKLELLERAGGTLSVSEVAKLLRISRQAVDKRRREGKLLAVPRGEEFAFPACQFVKGDVALGVLEILAILGDEPWTALEFMITPIPDLDDQTGLQAFGAADPALRARALRQARIAAGEGLG